MIQVGELIDKSLWFIFGKSDVLNISPWTHDMNYVRLSDISALYNVCSLHRGTFSTSRGVQCIGGYYEYIGEIP